MERGMQPGVDFFDDGSSGSDWEDSEGDVTQIFPEAEGTGLTDLGPGPDNRRQKMRGRSRERSALTALPTFNQLPIHDSGLGIEGDQAASPINDRASKKAREMSLKRLGRDKVRVVHTGSSTGTPRGSVGSNVSEDALPLAELPKPLPSQRASEASTGLPRSNSFKSHRRRNTSESMIADSIIDAHVMTMRALESLTPSGSLSKSQGRSYLLSATTPDLPKKTSFTADRHIKLSPLLTADPERPAHLPSHFIKTPYPFTAKKEFPKPKSRPRQCGADGGNDQVSGEFTRLDSGYGEKTSRKEHDDKKGKHILGLVASGGEYDLRSRLERNEDAQGIFRSRAGSGREGDESAIWLSLRRQVWRWGSQENASQKLVRIDVPSNLTTSSPNREGKKDGGDVEFDDKFFAERLRAGYRELYGNWLIRTFSARKLKSIQLGQTSIWSGCIISPNSDFGHATSGFLATGEGIDSTVDLKSPFTEVALMKIYKRPATGKARYTWVHWARRVAAANGSQPSLSRRRRPSTRSPHRRASSLGSPRKHERKSAFSPYSEVSAPSTSVCDAITTIQFVQSLSTFRILLALTIMLVVSVTAALLWVFLGVAGTGVRMQLSRERSDRVGSGTAIGILVLLLESVGFGSWVWFS